MSSGSTSWKVSPKWKRISLTHWLTSPFGAMTSVRLTSPRNLKFPQNEPGLDGLAQADLSSPGDGTGRC